MPRENQEGDAGPDKKAMSSVGWGLLGNRSPAKNLIFTTRGTPCFSHLSKVDLDKMEKSRDPQFKEHIYTPQPIKPRCRLVGAMIEEVVGQSAYIGSSAMQVVSESAAGAAAASDTLTIPLKVAIETFHSVSTLCLGLLPPHLPPQHDILSAS